MPVYFSKKYTTTANIAAQATSTEAFVSEADQYGNAPFDAITITNEDDVALAINLDSNPENRIVVLANSQETGIGLGFRTWNITNIDAAAAHTLGKVHILVENTKFKRRE